MRENMILLVTIPLGVMELLLYFGFMDYYFSHAPQVRKRDFFFYGILNFMVTCYCNVVLRIPWVGLVASVIMSVLLAALYSGSLRKRIVYLLTFSASSFLLIQFATYLIRVFLNRSNLYWGKLDFPALQGLFIAIIIRFWIIEFFYYKERMKENRRMKAYFYYTIPTPLLSSAILIFISKKMEVDLRSHSIAYAAIFLFVIVTNLSQYLIQTHAAKLYREQLYQMAMLQNFEYREDYYHKVEKYQEDIRRIRHDIKNQLIAMLGMLEQNHNEEVSQELKAIISDMVRVEGIFHTKNPGINAILCAKQDDARAAGIDLRYSVEVPEEWELDAIDAGVLIGNTLDNAIEASKQCDKTKRYIVFEMSFYEHKLYISCRNSMKKKPLTGFRTRKLDYMNHGIGLKSIDRVLDKYQGSKEIQVLEGEFIIEMNLWNV